MKTELQRVKPPYSYKEIGFRVRSLREANGYTRDALAVKIDISTKFLYEIEMGKKGFSAEILYKLSQTLAVSADSILTGTDGSPICKKMLDTIRCLRSYQKGCVQEILRTIQEMCTAEKVNNR